MGGTGAPAPPQPLAAPAGTAASAPDAGSVRLQFEGGQRLGGCVAWDSASGLLAVELQAGREPAAGGGEAAAAAAVAIVDPQAPESHFVARVPPCHGGCPGEGLAALLWSPPAARRLLLAITASGAAFVWTMDAPAPPETASPDGGAAAGSSALPGGGGGGGGGVACVNQWYGRFAFQLPVQRDEACGTGEAHAPAPPLLCCRLLGGAAAAASWDGEAAPPFADSTKLSSEQVCDFYRQRGLERAFAPAAVQPGTEPHWLRPGLLCLAAVTRRGQLLLALSGRGVAGGGGRAGDRWVLPPALPLQSADLPPDGGSAEASAELEVLLADVAPAAGGSLLVSAVAAAAAPAGGEAAAEQPPRKGPGSQLLLFEVAGPPQPLLTASMDGEQPQQQQQQVARLVSPHVALPPGGAPLCLAFLPGGAASPTRLLVAGSDADGGSTARVLCCSSGATSLEGLHSWGVQPGPSLQLAGPAATAAAAVAAAAADGTSLALLLPGSPHLLCLHAGCGGGASGDGGAALSLRHPPVAAPLPAAAAGAAGAPAGLACSPHGVFAAAARRGASALLLLPLTAPPAGAADVEPFMLLLGKRCCGALLAGTAGTAAAWDLTQLLAAVVRRWGHTSLQATQQLVDAAVAAVRDDARPQYAAAWSRLKAALLAAAAAAHPAAAADAAAAAVRADAAAQEWMATAAHILDAHLPDKAARAAAAKQGAAAEQAALVKLVPARYWAAWAADFSCYLARCLLHWIKLNQRGSSAGGGGGHAAGAAAGLAAGADAEASAAAAAFAAEQSAGPDCLPCVQLLSDVQFYRSFNRLVHGLQQFHRLLSNTLHRSKAPNTSHGLILQQLQVVQDSAVLLRALHGEFSKAQTEAAAPPPADGGQAAARLGGGGGGHSSAWKLVCGQPARPLGWKGAAAALQKLQQQQGNSSLLARVRQLWSKAGAGEQRESVEGLLEAAAQLGLLPASPLPNSGGGGGWQRGCPCPALAELLQIRATALAAAEAGEGLPGGVPLPSMPPQPLAWAGEEEGMADVRAADASGGRRGQQRVAARQLAVWELERAAGLGLPLPQALPSATVPFQGRLDVLTGRPLSWEHGPALAAADGGCATAELQPAAFAPASALAWQAAYAAAAPIGGQRWKRLRVDAH